VLGTEYFGQAAFRTRHDAVSKSIQVQYFEATTVNLGLVRPDVAIADVDGDPQIRSAGGMQTGADGVG